MNDTEKLDDLIQMVQELRDEVKALREDLERDRANRRTNWQQIAPLNGTWSDPNETGTPYRNGQIHVHAVHEAYDDGVLRERSMWVTQRFDPPPEVDERGDRLQD